ncbi:MAG: hypothetical protein HOC23_18410 [Halieaceae bacterium]|jgi:putative flippase GtrA|nr:hypothetical protein [Halieaceae bacterium]
MPLEKMKGGPLTQLIMQLFRYGGVGGVSTLIHIAIAITYIRLIDEAIIWANVAGFLVAFCFSYVAQSLFVFRARFSMIRLTKFFGVQVIALTLSLSTSLLFTGAHPYFKVCITAILLPLMAFAIHKLWTFTEVE